MERPLSYTPHAPDRPAAVPVPIPSKDKSSPSSPPLRPFAPMRPGAVPPLPLNGPPVRFAPVPGPTPPPRTPLSPTNKATSPVNSPVPPLQLPSQRAVTLKPTAPPTNSKDNASPTAPTTTTTPALPTQPVKHRLPVIGVTDAAPTQTATRKKGAPTLAPNFEMKESCTFCNATFDTIHRRHHCKSCGKTACGKCSSKKISLPKLGLNNSVRVCDFCFAAAERPEGATPRSSDTLAKKLAASLPPLETANNLPAKFSLMTTDFAAVLNQATAGAKEITIFKDFCARVVRHEADSARRLEKIMAEEMARLSKVFEIDRVTPFTNMWERVVGCMKKTIELDLKKVAAIEAEVVAPLAALEKLVANKLKEITTLGKKQEHDMTRAVDALLKSQDQCLKLLAAVSEPPKPQADPQVKMATLKTHLGDHTLRLQEANKQSELFAEGVSECLDELQAVEAHRIQMILNSLEQFFLSRQEANVPENADMPLEVVRSVNARQCLHMFIADWISDYGPKITREPFIYSLPLTAQQLDEGHVLRKGCQMFDLPLSQLLEKEKQGGISLTPLQVLEVQKSGKPLEIPLIMYTLCQAIRDMGGLQTEGIFRVSVDSTLLMELRNQFDSGNFALDLMKGDPHAAACLLKLWLRSLTDPIIHRSLYNEATVGYHETCSRLIEARRGDPGVRPEEQSKEVCMGIYEKLSPSYQAIVSALTALIKDVLLHSEHNLMSYEALAVVFAPGFFRAPACEAMEVMQQNRRELQFLVAFLKSTCQTL